MPVLATIAPNAVLYLAAALFSVGLVGVACRRNILVMLLSVEIMINAANLAFVAFSKVHGDVDGQVFVFFAMTVAAAEVAVGLAIVITVYRLRKEVDADVASDLAETDLEGVPPIKPEGPGGAPPKIGEMDDRASTLDDGHGHGTEQAGHGQGHGHGSEQHGHEEAPAEAEAH